LIISKKYFFISLFLFQVVVLSQTDWIRWEKSDPTFQIPDPNIKIEHDIIIENATDAVLNPIIYSYWFFISDVDGDNCPFYPSCSRFFLQSVRETNFAQGVLMFFDRFTRDTDFVNRQSHYPYFDGHHFYDPVSLYTLSSDKIKYIPPNLSVKE
jgi:putative component of membrane protein insertase Oxa1/YidC/SpoIIIJ protein YidD